MKVTVIDREKFSPYIAEVTIEISDNCPVCGGKRGNPYGYNFYEDGGWYWCNRWDNPCGHIDHYDDCLKEAQLMDKQNDTSARGVEV
jgi:hypothetical protein